MVNFSVMGYEHFECSFHDKWKVEYDQGQYFLSDPVFIWAIQNEGSIRWSNVEIPDPSKIMEKSKRYGIVYGATFAAKTGTKRSMVFVARKDRELTDEEMATLEDLVFRFFDSLLPPPSLSDEELEMLRLRIQKEFSYKKIGECLAKSEGTVKSAFARMRGKFGCSTTERLAFLVKERNLLGVDPVVHD